MLLKPTDIKRGSLPLRRNNRKSIRIVGFILAAVIFCGALSLSAFAVTDDEKAEINDKIDDIRAQIEANEKKIAELEAKASEYDGEINSLQDKIDVYNSQIGLINDEIALIDDDIYRIESQKKEIDNEITSLNNQIAALDEQIAGVQQQIADTYVLLGNRIRASYMSGPASELEYILTSDEFKFDAYLERVELINRVAAHDDELIADLEKSIEDLKLKMAEIEDAKVRLAEKVKELEKVQKEFEAKKQEQVAAREKVQVAQDKIQADLDKIMAVIDRYNSESDEYRDAIERGEQAINDYERKLAEESNNHGSGQVNGDMIWPLPYSDTYISSPYGMRYIDGGTSMHNGMDICRWSGTYGAEVVAVKEGYVSEASYGSGFGNYVCIDHGEGVETYYCHFSSTYVSAGDYVTQGTVIGAAGNTGYSFGAHLHFAILINGAWVNPLSYLTQPAGGVEVCEF